MRRALPPPRDTDWPTLRSSASPRNMSASSNQAMPMWPKGTLIDLIFLGLSHPRNRTSCPVDLLTMRSVDSGSSYSSSRPRALMAHTT